MSSAFPRLVAACGLAAALTGLAACTAADTANAPRPIKLALTVTDDTGDVGGPKTFAGTYPPADIVEVGYGTGGGDLAVRWTLSGLLEETGEETVTYGIDSRDPGRGTVLFSARTAGSRVLITDGAGFSHPCPQATVTANREGSQVTARIPLTCLGSPAELTLTASTGVHRGADGDRLVAFDVAAGSQSLDTVRNTVVGEGAPDHAPSGSAGAEQEDEQP